jgi:sigma-B regulation protein RsbU (phosphoserine phosphatase)
MSNASKRPPQQASRDRSLPRCAHTCAQAQAYNNALPAVSSSSPTGAPKQAGPGSPPVPQHAPAATYNGHRPRIFTEIDKFWARVTEGMQVSDLWLQFKRDAQTGFRLYKHDYQAGAPADQRKAGPFFQRVQELMWAILSKLTPARRVLLLIGVILLLLPSGGFQFQHGGNDVQISSPGFQFWGGLVLFVLLMLEIADRVVMKRDLEIARDIQSWLLPTAPPVVPGLAIAFATRPANTVAGDYYDIFPRSPGTGEPGFLLAVADVAGKSIPAALLMATFQASLKTLSATPSTLLDLVAGMNRYACSNSQGGLRFTTAFIAEFNPATRVLQYVNAGHNNPILRRSSGAIERLSTGGVPLGIQPDATYAVSEVSVSPGDWVVIFTDGLVEAENQAGEAYGEDRLLGVLQAGIALSPDILLQRMIAEVNTFVGATPQHDDITCMVLKVD